MEFQRIVNESSAFYSDFKSLYESSFPLFEQRTQEQQALALASPAFHLDIYTDENCFIGFIAWWEFVGYLYIEHFAIHPSLRGKGCGGKVLTDLKLRSAKLYAGKRLLLEIDPITDAVSANRLHFYEINGFQANPYSHVHPPYRKGYEGHDLMVLTTGGIISQEEYEQFRVDLNGKVMCFSPDVL